jgi:hypothetical protein
VILFLTVTLVAMGALSVAWLLARITRLPRPDFDRMVVPNTTPVVVAVTDRLRRRDLDIVIQRRATLTPHDVILVRPRALRPELLAQAVETLRMTRGSFGRLPDRDLSVEVEGPGATMPPRVIEAENWVRSIRSVKPMDLPGVGVVRLIVLHMFDRELSNP